MFKHCTFVYQFSKQNDLADFFVISILQQWLNKRESWVKKLLITGLVLAVIAAGIYWYIATEKFSDTKDSKAAFTVNAIDFIREFRKDDSAANKKYQEKIITVNGRVSELEAADSLR